MQLVAFLGGFAGVLACSDSPEAVQSDIPSGPSMGLASMPVSGSSAGMTAGQTENQAANNAGQMAGAPAPQQPPPGEQPAGAGAAAAPTPVQMPMAGMMGEQSPQRPTGENCLQGSGDFNEDGPYATGQMDVSIGSSGMYTIFYPEPLEEGCPHPIVAWGNGTTVTGSATYAFYHQHAATWGIVTIASHDPNTGSGEFHRAGLDYLLEQNADPSSMFYQRLSPRAGVSGHSQGGAGANAGARHENVEAEVNVQGAFGRAPGGVAFLCLTGTEDIAIMGCRTAVDSTDMPALYANWQGGTHTGTATIGGFISGDQGTLQYRRLNTAWFRCFLADDAGACELFEGGASCPVCTDSGWAEIEVVNF